MGDTQRVGVSVVLQLGTLEVSEGPVERCSVEILPEVCEWTSQ